MEMTSAEVVLYIESILPHMFKSFTEEEKQSVWDKVKRFVDSPLFSLRALNRAFSFYEFDKDEWYPYWVKTMGVK